MYTKEFTQFVLEVKWIELDMPYFYFCKYSFSFHLLKVDLFHVTFSALIILGIGSGVSLIVFISEYLFAKYFV